MANDSFKDIERLESDLWEAADNLRANSKLTSSDYFMPVLGVIFASVTKKEFSAQELLEPPARLKRAFQEVTVP